MNITPDFEKTTAFTGEAQKLPAGGYVCRIMKGYVEMSKPNNSEQLCLALDIAEGDYADYFKKQWSGKKSDPNAKWSCNFKQFTLDKDGRTNPWFKGLLTCVEKSNAGYVWNWDERSLAGKLVGVVFREEEFLGNDGNVHTIARPAFIRSVEMVRNGVPVPEIKRLANNVNGNFGATTAPAFVDVTEEESELPF